jgi:DNA invertase Pin-like site-specific DNA recombinase
MKYVAYYRVSTKKQGQSGLGLEAQKSAVLGYAINGEIIAEFIEVESGKNNNRAEIDKALKLAKENEATLVVAKLDRLSRNLTFISSLMDSKVKFICCDMPEANEFTIHIFGALAQQERKMISDRTKKALAELKQKHGTVHYKTGTKNNMTEAKQAKAVDAIKDKAEKNPNNRTAKAFAKSLSDNGKTPAEILRMLKDGSFKTSRGKAFTQIIQVQRLLK